MLLEEFLKPLGISRNRLPLDIRIPATRIGQIVRGKRAICADTALRLGRYFDMSPQFWLNLQQTYDLSKSDGRAGEENCSRGPGLRCSQHGQARSRSQP
jgi:antitoxin HigA-1